MHHRQGRASAWGIKFLALVAARRTTCVHQALSTQLQTQRRRHVAAFTHSTATPRSTAMEQNELKGIIPANRKLLIHWRGEGVEGYSLQFRHVEFRGALSAILNCGEVGGSSVDFINALNYTGTELTGDLKLNGYNQAMQYLDVPDNVPVSACVQAVQRCSLIHAFYLVVAESPSFKGYDALSEVALHNNAFDDMRRGGPNAAHTWCVRVRHYGANEDASKERRYGARARSLTMERQALKALTPVLLTLGGKVDLDEPDCKIYIFDGLQRNQIDVKVLARRVATGARVSVINPNTRICVTNTPLCPVAAFTMCNVAQIKRATAILDPFCGSGAILLAAAMIVPSSRTVGIEIAHDGIVCRDDIREDFRARHLTQPAALVLGDSSHSRVRAHAREAIGNVPFDSILTDPPYGIRESTGFIDRRPIDELLRMIMDDRDAGTPLLRLGGRLVVFLPQQMQEESFADILPTPEQMQAAGLRCELTKRQPLNDILSRWLVSFVCIA